MSARCSARRRPAVAASGASARARQWSRAQGGGS
jgi:hypothetical protein